MNYQRQSSFLAHPAHNNSHNLASFGYKWQQRSWQLLISSDDASAIVAMGTTTSSIDIPPDSLTSVINFKYHCIQQIKWTNASHFIFHFYVIHSCLSLIHCKNDVNAVICTVKLLWLPCYHSAVIMWQSYHDHTVIVPSHAWASQGSSTWHSRAGKAQLAWPKLIYHWHFTMQIFVEDSKCTSKLSLISSSKVSQTVQNTVNRKWTSISIN